ncbi:ferredoxin [Mycolicibacterium aichiense]|uniref:Ferredoxin n=1 Tax=Mycolicibacterium aichiense TaxID=1799 RepID=A0AAD1MA18_9MYCO|nr:ferredoxin [Mycolicibacterium aichiense]MCV7017682.1 ferredoxin [Mycolicibacterium aichiense]BBX06707.1 cytochrome P450 [Mycolicibacterium aichiense]STZ23957.1 ferredoxin [Mycolicibacterium aichiense]
MTAARWRVQVDRNLCEGHALCVELAPAVFDVDSSDLASCLESPADEMREQVEAAVAACPRQAISIVKGTQE